MKDGESEQREFEEYYNEYMQKRDRIKAKFEQLVGTEA